MNTKQHILLSKKGMKELKKRITETEQRRDQARQKLRLLDRSSAREERLARASTLLELEAAEDELIEQRTLLANAKPLPTRRARLKVAIGSVVDIIDQQGRLFRYTLVDSVEVNPNDGRISIESPLGKSLLGKSIRDTVYLSTSKQQRSFRLVRIT